MSASLRLEGIEELKRALQQLPRELADEARGIVMNAAAQTERDVDAVYARHEHTGNLRRGLTGGAEPASAFGARAVVRSRAKHAWIVERGTAERFYSGTDKRGRVFRNAARGRSPEQEIFIRSAERHRRVMWQQLVALLRRVGFQVTGDVA